MCMAPLSRRRLDSLGLGFDSAALERDQSGAEEWTIAVAFGTPPQVAHLIFDTGSSDLWVRAHAYNASKSSTASKKGSSSSNMWQIQYGGGGVHGIVMRDSVQVLQSHGGASLTATNAAFAVATNSWKGFNEPSGYREEGGAQEGIFATLKGDGVLGMAFRNLNAVRHDKQATLMDHFVAQGQVKHSGFAIYLAGSASGSSTSSSESFVAFGVNASTANLTGLVSGPTNSTKVAPGGFWVFATPLIRVVGKGKNEGNMNNEKEGIVRFGEEEVEEGSIAKLCHSKCFAMVDSGSSFLGVPRELYPATVQALSRNLLAQLGSSACTPLGSSSSSSGSDESAGASNPYALQACRCSRDDLLLYPNLEIELSTGETVALFPSDYLQLLPKRSQTAWCYLGIRPANHPAAEAPTFILGSSFLKAYYSHFDYSSRQLSFTRTTSSINSHFLGFDTPSDSEPSPVASLGNSVGGIADGHVLSSAGGAMALLFLAACVITRLRSRTEGILCSVSEYELVEVEMWDADEGSESDAAMTLQPFQKLDEQKW